MSSYVSFASRIISFFFIVIKIYSYLSLWRSDEAQFLVILPNEWLLGGRIMLLCLYRRLVYQ